MQLVKNLFYGFNVYEVLVIFTLIGSSCCLHCWHCIGDMCNEHPSSVESASSRSCSNGEICQKVYYMGMYDGKSYESTVRSCSSGECIGRNDFENCTRDVKENPGCMQRLCCDDSNNCNISTSLHATNIYHILMTSVLSFQVVMRLLCT